MGDYRINRSSTQTQSIYDLDGNQSDDVIDTESSVVVGQPDEHGDATTTFEETQSVLFTGFATEEEARAFGEARRQEALGYGEAMRGQIEGDFDGNMVPDTVETDFEVGNIQVMPSDPGGPYNVRLTSTQTTTITNHHGAPGETIQLEGHPAPRGDALDEEAVRRYEEHGRYTPHTEGLALQPGVSGPDVSEFQGALRYQLDELEISEENVTGLLGTYGPDGNGIDGYYGPRTDVTAQFTNDLFALEQGGFTVQTDRLNEQLASGAFNPAVDQDGRVTYDPSGISEFIQWGDHAPGTVVELPSGHSFTVPGAEYDMMDPAVDNPAQVVLDQFDDLDVDNDGFLLTEELGQIEGTEALQEHADSLIFGNIDPTSPAWHGLSRADLGLISERIANGESIEQIAREFRENSWLGEQLADDGIEVTEASFSEAVEEYRRNNPRPEINPADLATPDPTGMPDYVSMLPVLEDFFLGAPPNLVLYNNGPIYGDVNIFNFGYPFDISHLLSPAPGGMPDGYAPWELDLMDAG